DDLHYVSAPDDLDGVVQQVENFLARHDGKRRINVDSLTEMAYYADEDAVADAADRILALLEEYDATGLFHLSKEVHDEETLAAFREQFDGVIELDEDGNVTVDLN
ncbi:MAG: hypothetical protein ABEI99_06065, partial [Halobaculum sp.]